MANRCPDCNKFVGLEQGDPEVTVNSDMLTSLEDLIEGDVRLVLNCADCGSEMAEATVQFEAAVNPPGEKETPHKWKKDCSVDVSEDGAEPIDRYDGKPGTPMRYQRHWYGADVTLTLECSCGWKGTASGLAEEQAGAFESSV